MTEQQKARAEIKKEFQNVVSSIRKDAKLKEFPKGGASAADMKKDAMEMFIHTTLRICPSRRSRG